MHVSALFFSSWAEHRKGHISALCVAGRWLSENSGEPGDDGGLVRQPVAPETVLGGL